MINIVIMISIFFVMIFLGIPVAFALGLSSIAITFFTELTPTMVIQQTFRGLDSFPLLAVPFFLLVGQLMNDNGVTKRLIGFSNATVGHIRGGLGHVNVLVSMIFAGMSGSSTADTVSIGSVLIPEMIEEGYSKEFSVAVTAASSTIGVIIPPSIMMVIYGSMGGASTGALLVAGAIPGIVIGLSQMVLVYIHAVKNNNEAIYDKFSFSRFIENFKNSYLALLIPLLLIGGIVSGLFTPTEASMVVAVYTIFLGFVYKTTDMKRLFQQFVESVKLYAITLFCVGTATSFSWILAYYKAPDLVIKILNPWLDHPTIVLFLVMVVYMALGTIIDAVPAIIIVLPILMRINDACGINPLHMGIIVCLTLALGLVTPPYGLCLLIAAKIGKLEPFYAFSQMLNFVILFLAIIIIIILVPGIALWLPKIFFPRLFL